MLLTALSQALIALQRYALAAAGPVAGLAVFVLTCSLVTGAVPLRVATSLSLGVLAALTVPLVALARHLPTTRALVDA